MWQSIETCPYDVPVMVYGGYYRENNFKRSLSGADNIGVYIAIRSLPDVSDDGFVLPFDDNYDECSWERFEVYGSEFYVPEIKFASHWMPLPEIPEIEMQNERFLGFVLEQILKENLKYNKPKVNNENI